VSTTELRAHEFQLLEALQKHGGKASAEQAAHEAKLPQAAVMRAALALKEKGLITMEETRQSTVKLTSEGSEYAVKELPERRLVNVVVAEGGEAPLEQAATKAGLTGNLVQIALGWTQRKKWAQYNSKTGMLKAAAVPREESDEQLLKTLSTHGEASTESLSPEFKAAVQTLKRRGLVRVDEKTVRTFHVTDAGKHAMMAPAETVTQLTPTLIVTGKWRSVKLQEYNIEAAVANTWPGKKHPYLSFLEEVRAKLVELGFTEMTGTNVETSFFNFDALYTPQDHPAREIFGIYYVKNPEYGDLSAYEDIVQNVKATHENGWKTGSTGWKYTYSIQEARRLILRGHGTCLSARTLVSRNLKVPGKYFSIARCYRPEVVDKTHLSEFNQVEGIIVDENLTLRDLLGVLEKFAVEIAGADKVRFKPDYFPFTEPSVELSAYKEGYGWVEFGGSGIFRPEVTLPLGVNVPVIAWGLGVDRLFMMRAGIDDIRYIFSQDINWLRRMPVT
jgi:phenylalanyl-tRNA synthetase alpha chain